MPHISSELLNEKTLSLWLVTIAMLAFASGYDLASMRQTNPTQTIAGAGQIHFTDLAMGKYGHPRQRH